MKNYLFKIAFIIIVFITCNNKPASVSSMKRNVAEKKYLKVLFSIHQDTIKLKINNISDSTLHYLILLHGATDSIHQHRILYDVRNVKSYMMNYHVEYDSIKINKNETQNIDFVISDLKKELGIDYLKEEQKFCLYFRILNKKFLPYYSEDIVYFELIYKEKVYIELLDEF